MSLFWRMFCLNAVGLVAAAALLLGPVTVSTPVLPAEALVVAAGLGVLLVANAVVLRIGLAPLGRLGRAMASADLLQPGGRAVVSGPVETAELIMTYNAMLDRLEAERAASAGRALSAQEGERSRIARELHDEVGQTLTAVLLQLKRVADRGPDELREEIGQAQEATRSGLDEIRRIARRLRPGVLDELGLVSALRSLAAEFTTHGLSVRRDLAAGLPPLPEESELVIYRVAQEALTNTARHSTADRADLSLRAVPGGAELVVRDNGKGFCGAPEGAGIPGMRERALLVGARLTLTDAPGGGAEVRLRIPVVLPVEPRAGYEGGGAMVSEPEGGGGGGYGVGVGFGRVRAFAGTTDSVPDGTVLDGSVSDGAVRAEERSRGEVTPTGGPVCAPRPDGDPDDDPSASGSSHTDLPPAPGGQK